MLDRKIEIYFPNKNVFEMNEDELQIEEQRMIDLSEIKWEIVYIHGEPSKYIISNFGDLVNTETGYWLRSTLRENGYLEYRLYFRHNKSIIRKAHRLVALAFIPNPENKREVNHINAIKTDNWVGNLEWVTSSENKRHAWALGLYENSRNPGFSKVNSEELVHKVCKLLEEKYTPKQVADKLGITESLPRSIKYSGKWSYIAKHYNIPAHKKRIPNPMREYKEKIDDMILNAYSNEKIINTLKIENDQNTRKYILSRRNYLKNKERSSTIEPSVFIQTSRVHP